MVFLHCAEFQKHEYTQIASSKSPNVPCPPESVEITNKKITNSGYESWITTCHGKQYYCFQHRYDYFLGHPSQAKCLLK